MKRIVTNEWTARRRFRAIFEHDAAGLDRLPMLSLGTPVQGLFYQEWARTVGAEDLSDEYVRLTRLGDKTMNKWINSEWHNVSVTWPAGYPSVPLPRDHPEWARFDPETARQVKLTIGWNGSIHASGKTMHGEPYGWYVNGYFTRQKVDGRTLEPWEVRDEFYAEHGEPWDDQFAPGPAAQKAFKDALAWYEQNHDKFGEDGFADFALMCSAGGLFEATWEGMGSGTPAMAIMARKYPGKLRSWLRDVANLVMMNVKLQFELAEEVGAQIDFVWLWDDTGQKGRTLVSPKHHREFWVPLYKEVCRYVHARGGFVIIHSCGFGESLIPNWVEAGIDAWQTVERAALNEPSRVREEHGGDIVLVGAVDASNVVSFAKNTREVEEHVRETIRDAVFTPEDPCYVPGFTHDLLDCPVANVRAAVDAMLHWGAMDRVRALKGRE
ncbi:MAG: hypothetical protein Kow0069_27770 [Promethearchaeota archaeon]